MANTSFETVDQFIQTHPGPVQKILREVRTALTKALPSSEEGISYQIPVFKVNGKNIIFFSAWKGHYSIYPIGPDVVAFFKKELAAYETNSKGTLRLEYDEPVPGKLIGRIAKFLLDRSLAREATKKSGGVAKKKKKTPAKKPTRKPAAKPAARLAAKRTKRAATR